MFTTADSRQLGVDGATPESSWHCFMVVWRRVTPTIRYDYYALLRVT